MTIIPHLWYDTQAHEAAELYTSLFPGSRVVSRVPLPDTPSGDAELVTAELFGQTFYLLSAGPLFRFTPAISFVVTGASAGDVDRWTGVLAEGGEVLMPLGSYPFAGKFAWVNDRFGLSWQVLLRPGATPGITPRLTFAGGQAGRAEEAIRFYASVFPDSVLDHLERRGPGEEPDRPGWVRQAGFTLCGQSFSAMDSAAAHAFGFNEAVSLLVDCSTQDEVDRFWTALSADPDAEACGWLKDRFGVSWQVSPRQIRDWIGAGGPAAARVLQAEFSMKKLDLAALEAAYRG